MTDADANGAANASLLDTLVDGFEKNEVFDGFHERVLPMLDEAAAVLKFEELANEARRWKGEPVNEEGHGDRRLVTWRDLEILQRGRGILVRARAPWFDRWWHRRSTWADDPMGLVRDWQRERDELQKSKP
jgi:hypothetical protein